MSRRIAGATASTMSACRKLSLLTVATVVCVVAGRALADSCPKLESIDPCDVGTELDVVLGRCGIRVTEAATAEAPVVKFPEAKDYKKYLLVMVDPDAPSAEKPKFRYWRHWVVSDITGSSLRSGHLRGTTWSDYYGPSPPPRSGPHRYQLFLYEQSGDLVSVETLGNQNRGKWQLGDFIRINNLCDSLVAAYEFIVENKG